MFSQMTIAIMQNTRGVSEAVSALSRSTLQSQSTCEIVTERASKRDRRRWGAAATVQKTGRNHQGHKFYMIFWKFFPLCWFVIVRILIQLLLDVFLQGCFLQSHHSARLPAVESRLMLMQVTHWRITFIPGTDIQGKKKHILFVEIFLWYQ